MQPVIGFEDWVSRTAMELAAQNERYQPRVPGSFSEAAAFLTSQDMLAPREDGLPSAYKKIGDEELILVAVYIASYLPVGEMDLDVEIFTSLDAQEEQNLVDIVAVEWETQPGHEKDAPRRARTFLSERGLPLSEFSCRDLNDLRRVYDRVRSARHIT